MNPNFARVRVLLALAIMGLLVLLVLRLRGTGKVSEEEARAAILKVLDSQVEAWNQGDLEGFMKGYWKSDELTFFSGGEEQRGWQETYDRYRRKYQGEGKEMGTLKFDERQIDVTGPKSAVVRGRWELTFQDGKTVGGLFTLLFREEPQGWCIVHDHTSAREATVPLPPPKE